MSYLVRFSGMFVITLCFMLLANSASATCIVTEICVNEKIMALLEVADEEDLDQFAAAFERESEIYPGECPEEDEQSGLCEERVSYQRETLYIE